MIRLRAIKGHMGSIDYYMTTATFGEIARIVRYKEDAKGWPVELRQQRPLNMTRVRNDMVPYLTGHPDHFYNALVVEHVRPGGIDHVIKFVPDANDATVGWIQLEASETLEALDGQHRLRSIELAVEESPDLARETIGLVVVPHRTVATSQQLFSDLNRNAKPTPKSLNILFEHREQTALLAKELATRSKYLAGKVNMTGSSLSGKSPYVVTISTLYEAVRIVEPVISGETFGDKATDLIAFWDSVFGTLPGAEDLLSGDLKPGAMRKKYVYATGLGFEALAEVAKVVRTQYPGKWKAVLAEGLPRVKWSLGDTQWEGVATIAGRVAVARAPRRLTATLIKYLLKLPVDEKHLSELKETYTKLKRTLPVPVLAPDDV